MDPSDLQYASVADLRRLLGEGEVSPLEVVDSTLRRIDVVQPALNCFAFVWAEEALNRARQMSSRGRRSSAGTFDEQPLFGVPVAIKDTTPWSGHPMTQGSVVFRDHVSHRTAGVVESLIRAGAIIIGSTNTPEFAHAAITDNRLQGATRNPWNPERSPGGSSGGAGVAVSTGCVTLAEGSDMGGSVRIPAAWCGVVGLKPSLGRIPMDALPGLWDTLSHHGPLARSVDDAWEFLLATQGPSRRDPWSTLAPLERDRRRDETVAGLRVGLSSSPCSWPVDPEISSVTANAGRALESSGVHVESVDPAFSDDDEEIWITMWSVFMAGYYGHLLTSHRSDLDQVVVWLIEKGLAVGAAEYKRLEIRRSAVWVRIMAILDRHDAIICPTMAHGPRPATKADDDLAPPLPHNGRLHLTTVGNLVAPCPAVSVPGGRFSSGPHEGLPIGVQIIGRPGREDQVLALARLIEEWSGSARWRPPLPND